MSNSDMPGGQTRPAPNEPPSDAKETPSLQVASFHLSCCFRLALVLSSHASGTLERLDPGLVWSADHLTRASPKNGTSNLLFWGRLDWPFDQSITRKRQFSHIPTINPTPSNSCISLGG
ncbi:hypothetical protein CCM_03830 [Cordyceps militaris CM01]|uniref:Uncharacterized protein n=1 Tax=Cordyceps militaris (strain CM01) TaxID=983644 RepID=G3JGU3_CORMM|nr:uncharacterized protein CCM_03830 [Cordyceps militaris CM01]EGX92457.1 hypothetical protein CCM_03830 [Cordyceps militaris CM01]